MLEFETEIPIECEIEDVYSYMSKGEEFSRWNSAVKEVTKLTNSPSDVGMKYRMIRDLPNGRAENTVEIIEHQPDESFSIHTRDGPTPFKYHFTLREMNDAVYVTLKSEIEEKGLPFRLPKFLATQAIKKGVKDNLKTLKSILESNC